MYGFARLGAHRANAHSSHTQPGAQLTWLLALISLFIRHEVFTASLYLSAMHLPLRSTPWIR